MISSDRPLSPHLQIYRLPFLALMSISHRFTGLGLVVGTFALAWWLGSGAFGPAAFARASDCFGSPLGKFLLFGWSFCLFYHTCNGIRHLFWDIGKGYALADAKRSGSFVLGATVVLTLVTWAVGLSL